MKARSPPPPPLVVRSLRIVVKSGIVGEFIFDVSLDSWIVIIFGLRVLIRMMSSGSLFRIPFMFIWIIFKSFGLGGT